KFPATQQLLHRTKVYATHGIPGFCRKIRFLGKIQKSGVRNSMTYRLPNSRKSNFATEPKCVLTSDICYSKNSQGNSKTQKDPFDICGWSYVLHERIQHPRFNPFIEDRIFTKSSHTTLVHWQHMEACNS